MNQTIGPTQKTNKWQACGEDRRQIQAYEQASGDMQQQLRQLQGLIPSQQAHELQQEATRQIKAQLTAQNLWSDAAEAARQRTRAARKQIRYYHCDQIGTPLALTDEQGNIVWAARYDPWGNIREEYNADPKVIRQDIRLPGQHHDRHTGLYYNRHRYYDPALGAYINQDPIGLRGGIQPSMYANNNPFLYVDPLGLSGSPTCCAKKKCPTINEMELSDFSKKNLEVLRNQMKSAKLLELAVPLGALTNALLGNGIIEQTYSVHTTDWKEIMNVTASLSKVSQRFISERAGEVAMALEGENDYQKYKKEIIFWKAVYEGCTPQ